MTHGTSYKFALLERSIIRSSWEIVHNSSLENPIWIRLVALERGHRGLLRIAILEHKDPNVQSYNHFKIELLKERKKDMRKFDGKDPVTWILHMEQYFDLHHVQLLQKVCIAFLYLEPNQIVWYRGLFSRKPLVT